MQVVDTFSALNAARKGAVGRVGLVPTMGALHEGHLSLVREARADNDVVIVTVFINPTQFAVNEDISKYPHDMPHDLEMLRSLGVDIVFTPTSDMMYPSGFQTWVEVTQVSQGLEGASRPDHFRGVATVVSKLFNLTRPHTAYFGQKDAQQVVVIKRMVRDLNFPLEIAVCPISRELDGLAMSSRNVYLSAEHRSAAPVVSRALDAAADAFEAGERHPEKLRGIMKSIVASEPLAEPDYISVTDAYTLVELDEPVDTPLLLSLTVKFGNTRLLDNMLVPSSLNTREGLTSVLGG